MSTPVAPLNNLGHCNNVLLLWWLQALHSAHSAGLVHMDVKVGCSRHIAAARTACSIYTRVHV
jgi:hypothetical protein